MRRTLVGFAVSALLGGVWLLAQGPFRPYTATPGTLPPVSVGQLAMWNGTAWVASNCQVGGPTAAVLSCVTSLSAGDSTLPGALDLFGTNGAAVTLQAPASPSAYQIQMPAAPPTSGQKLVVSSVAGSVAVLAWQ